MAVPPQWLARPQISEYQEYRKEGNIVNTISSATFLYYEWMNSWFKVQFKCVCFYQVLPNPCSQNCVLLFMAKVFCLEFFLSTHNSSDLIIKVCMGYYSPFKKIEKVFRVTNIYSKDLNNIRWHYEVHKSIKVASEWGRITGSFLLIKQDTEFIHREGIQFLYICK